MVWIWIRWSLFSMSVFEHAQLGKEFTWDAIKCRDLSLRKGHQLPGGRQIVLSSLGTVIRKPLVLPQGHSV